MSSSSISFLALLCLILVSTISAEHSDLVLHQEIDLQRELNYAKHSKRSKRDWMMSPGSQRQYNSKYGQHHGAEQEYFYSRRSHKRGQHHHQSEGVTFENFESWGLNRIKEAIRAEKDSSSKSSSSSWRSSSSSSKSSESSSASSSDSAKEVQDAPVVAAESTEAEAIHVGTLDTARIEKESP